MHGNKHISREMVINAKKGLVALKTVAVGRDRMHQKILVILFQTLIMSVIEYMYLWFWASNAIKC